MTSKISDTGTCRPEATDPACRRDKARGAWRVARVAVVAVMAMVFGLAGLVSNADAANVTYHMRGVAAQSVGVDGNTNIVAENGVTYNPITGTQWRAIMSTTASTQTVRNRIRESANWSGWEQFLRMYTPVYSPGMTIGANATVSWDMYSSAGADVYAELYEYNDSTGVVGALKGTTNTLTVNTVPSHNILTFDNASFTVATGNRLVVYYYLNGNNTDPRPIFGAAAYNAATPAGDLYLVVDETAACADSDVATLTITDPVSSGTVSGTYTIQAQVGTETAPDTMSNMLVNIAGTAGGTCDVTNGVMTWNGTSSRWEYSWDTSACGTGTPDGGVTIDVSGNDPDCGTATNATQITNVTIDNTCTPTGSIVWNGTNTAAGDFNGSSFVTLTDIVGGSMEYLVTEGSGPGTPFEELEYFDTADDVCDYSNWTNSAESTGNCGGPFDAGTTGGFLYVYNSGQGGAGDGTLTGSTGTGPTSLDSGTSPPGGFLFLENSGGPPYADSYFTRNTSFDATTYEANISFASSLYVTATEGAALQFQVNDGGGWTTEWEQFEDDGNNGGWDQIDINLFAGTVSVNGGAYVSTTTVGGTGTAYTSGSLDYRFVFVSGSTWANDIGLDTIRVYGPAQASETTVINWTADPILAAGVLTGGNTYNLYARGTDATCGDTIYGDPAAQNLVADGTSQTFTWSSDSTPPSAGTVSVTPDSGTQVPAAFTITTIFTDAESAVTSCEYTLDGSAWSAGAVGGSGPYTCTANVTGQTDGASLTINMRATSGGGGPTAATAINRTVDAAAPGVSIGLAATTFGDPVSATVTFTESVTGFTAGDITVGGVAGASVANFVGSGANYTFDITGMSAGSGTLTADIAGGVAFDSVNNGNTAATQATSTWTSCVETGTVSVSISPDPDPADISGAVTVTANLGGGATNGLVRWRENGTAWSSWVTSGATYTPTDKSFGTVEFEAMADGSCGAGSPVYSATLARTFETRVDGLEPTLQSVVQAGLTSFRVTMIYCNDKNGTGTFQVEYKLATDPDIPGSWTTVANTPTADNGAGDSDATDESVVVLQGSLTAGETYDVRLTYIDATDGVIGTAVYDLQVELVAWTDNDMLHNALRFACDKPGYSDQTSCEGAGGVWTLDRKWATGWGTPTGEYGAIICSTCHTAGASNIKKVTSTVIASSGSFPGSGVVLNTVEDGSSDFGNDTGGHGTSDRICEVCHSVTNYHRFDTTGQAGGTDHYNQADCIKCHEHKLGFRAGCNACHGNPPLAANELTATLDPGNSTLSTTEGEHDVHVNTLGYTDCNTCHNGWETNGEMPKNGDINIGFVTPGTDGGTYDGRTTNSGYTADVNTTVTNGDTMTCAVYCHGYGSPVWNPASTAACGACHGEVGSFGDDKAGAPIGGTSLDLSGAGSGFKVGKHANHLDNSVAETGDPCALCHSGFGYADATHVDGTVNVTLNAAAGVTATFTPGSPGTCSSMDCHGDADWDSNAAGGCTLCHGYPPTSASSHASGVNPVNHDMFSATGVKDNHDDCRYCHGYKDNGSGVLLPLTAAEITALKGDPTQAPLLAGYHMDGSVTINGDFNTTAGDDAGYNSGNGGCDSAACHANDVNHRFTSANGGNLQLADIGPGACSTCHDGGDPAAPVITMSSPHTNITRGVAASDCTDCHSGHYTSGSGVQIPNNATVGISYTRTGHGGIMLGGTEATINANIRNLTTEAEICWACHTNDGSVSEWGTNNNSFSITYDYGSLSGNAASSGGWYSNVNPGSEAGATWDSAVFTYKQGNIQSTHSANSAGTSAVSGANYAKSETLDAVADIRCSYCHDVHDTYGTNTGAGPFLRGTWKGNPYNEDGAPRNGAAGTWLSVSYGGATNTAPRANASATNSTTKGGWWIDQNSNDPNNGETLATTAGLCTLCHGSNVDTMDETTGENLWVSGGNGHQNAVIGGTGTTATANNIFSIAKRGSNQVWDDNGNSNYYMSMGGWTPQMARRAYGIRGDAGNIAITPNLTGEHRYFNAFQWDNPPAGMALQVDDYQMVGNSTTAVGPITQSQYHTFNCGKCHNPHASRLPKLMITNCLDTAQNTWDETWNGGIPGAPSPWTGTDASNWPSAQNCHRLADDHSTTSRGAGWNYVTPW